MNHTTLTTMLKLRSTLKLRMTRNRILLSLLMMAGSIQPLLSTQNTSTSSYVSGYYCDNDNCYDCDNHYDYDADDIALCRSILTNNIEHLKSLIVPGNEIAAIKFLAPEMDFGQYYGEYFKSSTFLHLLSGLLDQDTITILKSNFSTTEIAQYRSKMLDLIKYALKIGIDINAINCFEQTALSLAVEYGAFDAAMLLIQSGANVNCVDEEGLTPLFLAVQNSFDQIEDHCHFTSEDKTSKPFVFISNAKMVQALLAAGAQTSMVINGQTFEFSHLLDEAIADIDYELHGWSVNPAFFILKDELVAIKAVL